MKRICIVCKKEFQCDGCDYSKTMDKDLPPYCICKECAIKMYGLYHPKWVGECLPYANIGFSSINKKKSWRIA